MSIGRAIGGFVEAAFFLYGVPGMLLNSEMQVLYQPDRGNG